METVDTITVTHCHHCGASLEGVSCDCYERRTRIDILFEETVEHVDAEIKTCSACKKQVKAPHPGDMPDAVMYCRIASYLKTMSYQGDNPIIAIVRAFEGKFDRHDP